MKARSTHRSAELFDRACRTLVGGVNSPVRAFRAVGGTPLFVERAEGPYIFDADGNRYIDLVCSWGATIAGHAHPAIVEAVRKAAGHGLSFGACCKAEAELAEIIVGAIPSVELIRLVSSGTEAVMGALRLARGATGRYKIIKFAGCYHGHVDSLLVSAGSGATTLGAPDSAGVPAEFAGTTLIAAYNDLASVEQILTEHERDVAAVIVEPIAGNMGFVPPAEGFLAGLRAACDRHGCLLIFDEVMTGFRVAWGGYQNVCGVRPDLTCLGKVIGGGMPVAAYGGKRELMEQVAPLGAVYQAGTLSGNPLAMAAGAAALTLCSEPKFYERLQRASSALADGLWTLAGEAGILLQTGARGGMCGLFFSPRIVENFVDAKACDHVLYARFFHAMLKEGVWLPPSSYEAMFITAAHVGEPLDAVLAAAGRALRSLPK